MPSEHHLAPLLCTRLQDFALRLPLRAHCVNPSASAEFTSLHQMMSAMSIAYTTPGGAHSLLHAMRVPLHAGPRDSAFYDAFVHYAPFFEPAPDAVDKSATAARNARDEYSPRFDCCVLVRHSDSDAVQRKWYSDIEKAVLICMCCFLGDRLRLLRHDSEYLKSLPGLVRTWLLDNNIESNGSPCTVVRPYTRVEVKRHRVLRDVLEASFLDRDNDVLPASPQPPTAQHKQLHVALWYLLLCNGALQKAAVHANRRLPHIRYMFEHYSAGERGNKLDPAYIVSQHNTLVGRILDNVGCNQRHLSLSKSCVDFNNHLSTGNNDDIVQYFPDHAAIMLQVVRRVPVESQLVHQITLTAQCVMGTSPRSVPSQLQLHVFQEYSREQFTHLLANSNDYKLLSEIDTHVLHTCSLPAANQKSGRFVFVTVPRQVAIRVLHWYREINKVFELHIAGLNGAPPGAGASCSDIAMSPAWVADIAVLHDLQTSVVMRRESLRSLHSCSLLAMLSQRSNREIDFVCAHGAVGELLVQLCKAHGTGAALRGVLQIFTGAASGAGGFEKHVDTIDRVHKYLFDMQYTQMETQSVHPVFWFLDAGHASNMEFGGFSHMMLVLLLMPFARCTASKASLDVLFQILDKDTLRPIKRETLDARRLKAAALMSTELRGACRKAPMAQIYCADESPAQAEETLQDSEKSTILAFLTKAADRECLETWRIHPDLVFACISRVSLHLPCSRAYFDAITGSRTGPNPTALGAARFSSGDKLQSAKPPSSIEKTQGAALVFAYALRNRDLDEHLDVVQHAASLDADHDASSKIQLQGQLCSSALALPEFSPLDEIVNPHIMGFLMQSIEAETLSGRSRVSPKCPLYPVAPGSCPVSSTSARHVKPLLPSLTLNAISETSFCESAQPAFATLHSGNAKRAPASASPMYSPSQWESTDSEQESRSTHRVSHMSPRPNHKRHHSGAAIRDLR
jgi:hypothetical protein